MTPQTLHARIRRGRWDDEILDRLTERRRFVEDLESKAAGEALLHLEQDVGTIIRHHLQLAQEARELVHGYIRRLRSQRNGQLAPRDMIPVYRLAVEEERRALGLAQTRIELNHTHEEIEDPQITGKDVINRVIELAKQASGELGVDWHGRPLGENGVDYKSRGDLDQADHATEGF